MNHRPTGCKGMLTDKLSTIAKFLGNIWNILRLVELGWQVSQISITITLQKSVYDVITSYSIITSTNVQAFYNKMSDIANEMS